MKKNIGMMTKMVSFDGGYWGIQTPYLLVLTGLFSKKHSNPKGIIFDKIYRCNRFVYMPYTSKDDYYLNLDTKYGTWDMKEWRKKYERNNI